MKAAIGIAALVVAGWIFTQCAVLLERFAGPNAPEPDDEDGRS